MQRYDFTANQHFSRDAINPQRCDLSRLNGKKQSKKLTICNLNVYLKLSLSGNYV